MGRLARRHSAAAPDSSAPRTTASRTAALCAAAVFGLSGFAVAGQLVLPGQAAVAQTLTAARVVPHPAVGGARAGAGRTAEAGLAPGAAAGAQAGSFRRIILPDLLIVAPRGLTKRQVVRLGAITGVRNMITFDGAEVTAGGHQVSVIGVNPATFRSWVPLRTASDQAYWTALSRGQFVADDSVASRLRLHAGKTYRLTGAISEPVRFGSAAQLGLNGVDLLVNQAMSGKLGLVHQVAALISAPGLRMTRLTSAVSAILGPSGRLESLRSQQHPATVVEPGKVPSTYLELFKDSAARYCPGLSWTVLAAIGQIESGDGTNMGPSSAGALGPMQFEPATWARWGITGFGQSGAPDVLNPYDAVPAAARLLCADGAASGGHSLYTAIFDYNHADWYVREVLALAGRYAADYR
jgi:hypothetical protein